MRTVVVFGIEVDESCADYLRLVVKYASSGDSDEREVRRRALQNLGRLGCKKALFHLVERYARSGDSDEREVRRIAFEQLEQLDGL
jgi:HEAT repeat protein